MVYVLDFPGDDLSLKKVRDTTDTLYIYLCLFRTKSTEEQVHSVHDGARA